MVELKSEEELKNFKEDYGESSFLMIYENKNSDFYKCVEELAENKFKILFYVGAINAKNYKESNFEVPKLIVNIFFHKFLFLV